MKHAVLLTLRVLLLATALYAVSNALKEILLREDELLDTVLLVTTNLVFGAFCWSLGCRRRHPRLRRTSDANESSAPGAVPRPS